MKGFEKYSRQYFMPPEPCMEWTKKEYVDKAPVWCSVDLRDGNQSLIIDEPGGEAGVFQAARQSRL